MADSNLGTATIVYDHPEEGTVEKTVQNEHIAYFQDHWILKRGEDEAGNAVVRRIPVERVHYVERSVSAFPDDVDSLRKQVENVASDLRSKLLGGERRRGREGRERQPSEPVQIDVTDEDSDDTEGTPDTDD